MWNYFAENPFGCEFALLKLGIYVLAILTIPLVLLPVNDLVVADPGLGERILILVKFDAELLRTAKLSPKWKQESEVHQ